MDSGAYSAFTQGHPVNLEQYTEFCLANTDHISHIVNLDVIKPGDAETAASEGRQNFLYMREKGILSIPVYHAREHLKWFDYMIDEAPYIGISATSIVSPVESLGFLDLAWHYGTDSSGFPLAKYHAFGDAAPYSMLTYPWYSSDSSTWMMMGGRAGSVKLGGKSYNIHSKKVRDNNFIHANLTGPARESWEQECRFLGLNPDKIFQAFSTSTGSQAAMIRSYMVAADLIKLGERAANVDRFRKPKTLISKKKNIFLRGRSSTGTQRIGPPNIYFVLSPSAWYFNMPCIYALGIKNVLVSYYYVSREKPVFWNNRMIPFLYDPKGFCETDPKTKIFWEKLQEVLLNPIEEEKECQVILV